MSTPELDSSIKREFISMTAPGAPRAGAGGNPVQGAYTRPRGNYPRVAFIATHYNVDFSEHYLSTYMAKRGYGFLGWNTRFRDKDQFFVVDRGLVDIGLGVRWLRDHGADVVILLGNSGGGSLMATYNSQSISPTLQPGFESRLLPEVESLPRADMYVSLAAHPGRPDVLTGWLDPSVTDEHDPISVDPELDMYGQANTPPFASEFVDRYRSAQTARNQRITDWAKSELKRIESRGARDHLFIVPRTWADLRFVDPAIDPSERPTPWCYGGDPRKANYQTLGVARVTSLRSWLAIWSLETSQCRSHDHLARLSLPSLVIQANADSGVFPSDAREIFDSIAACDKEFVEVRGDHYFQEPSGARDDLADLIDAWVAKRS